MKIYHNFNELFPSSVSVFNRSLNEKDKTGIMSVEQSYQKFRLLVDTIKKHINSSDVQELDAFDNAVTGLYDAYNNGIGLNDIPNYRGPESFSSQNDNYLDAYADTIIRFAKKYLPYYDSDGLGVFDGFGGDLVTGFDKLIQEMRTSSYYQLSGGSSYKNLLCDLMACEETSQAVCGFEEYCNEKIG